MAYNLQPLINMLEEILNPQQTHWILDRTKPQLESLLQKAAHLQQILKNNSLPKLKFLETKIRDAAHRAEDIIEAHMVYRMLPRPRGMSFTLFTPDVRQVTQELGNVIRAMMRMVRKKTSSCTSWSGASFSSSKSVVVGVDEDLMQLKDRLTGMQRKLEIIPIVGMGGIGKTTLARNLYDDPLIVSHFDVRAWSTISQDYNMSAILSALVGSKIGKEHDETIDCDDLYKSLYGRRYMIVLDDIWSTRFWDDIRRYFPDNNNGSRIVITTRESDVANYADSKSLQHRVGLLSKLESWNLLRRIVFGEEKCPYFLLGIGGKIASDCGGLPLAINVVGGLLSKVERSRDVWENIGKDVRAAIAESGEQFSNILSLSYEHLPNHLKSCFLYMGVFPEDYEIKPSTLTHLWIAEGFVKSNGDKSLEQEAADYLKALVERNLLLVRREEFGRPKGYIIHDLLRDLSMRIADEENFLKRKNISEVKLFKPRRVIVNISYTMEDVCGGAEFMSRARSFILVGFTFGRILSPALFTLRLLRVLDIMGMHLEEFPTGIFQLVNLRYLAIDCKSNIPSGISRLWNLQTLIAVTESGGVTSEIWELSELRHMRLKGQIWFDSKYTMRVVQKKLQTIASVGLSDSIIKRGFFESIPNIKKLKFWYFDESPPSSAVDLSHLYNLDTLRCGSGYRDGDKRFLQTFIFPCNLRKLALFRVVICPVVLTTLSALPNLEVLKIGTCVFESEEMTDNEEWNAEEGDEFRSLQFLHLESLNLVRWRADETNFPKLRHLLVMKCSKLEEIPSGIGDIPTLQLIEMYGCSASAMDSAKKIEEVQQSDYDNYDLKLQCCR